MNNPPSKPALEHRHNDGDRLFSPSVARNRAPLLQAFRDMVGDPCHVLEIGSGTGEHGAFIATALPALTWQPSDPDPASRVSIAAWAETVPAGRMRPPLDIRVDQPGWWEGLEKPDVIQSVNMIHIAPRAAMEGLLRGAGACLAPGGKLFLYGPFYRNGETAPSNRQFDADLQRRNPEWGVRDLDQEVIPLAENAGLAWVETRSMPANNLTVLFQRR
ncbi:MAG: DUF938 domain-containing protein [Parvularcula sp.]